MNKFTPDAMRKRFHEARDERAAILAKSGPLREQRDQIKREYETKMADLNAQIKQAESGLYDLDMEIGALSKALRGKTGKREDVLG